MSTYPAGQTTLNHITYGYNGWEDTRNTCGYGDEYNIDPVYDGDYDIGWHSYDDNNSVVDFGSVSPLPYPCNQTAVLACTTRHKDVNNWIYEADLRFNSAQPWVHSGQASGFDVEAVSTHEAGHWLIDLNDLYCECNEWMTMYGYTATGQVRQQTLAQGDVLGMRNAYP